MTLGAASFCVAGADLEMCFAPQRRALFRRLNFQKWPENGVFCTFDLEMCFAPQGREILISYLARWLCTRRFSEVTFRPSGATNNWKNAVNRDFPTYSRTCIFFLLTLLSSLIFSLLFFSCLTLNTSAFPYLHIVGSLTSKLPSIIGYYRLSLRRKHG